MADLNNDLIDNRAVYVPNPDTVAEFRILTSNLIRPNTGATPAAVITVATQSGTNKYHGTAFDFLRNDFSERQQLLQHFKPAFRATTTNATSLGGLSADL